METLHRAMSTRPLRLVSTTLVGSRQFRMDIFSESVLNERLDTAQSYRNEEETGTALHDSGLSREDVYITTKFSGRDGLDVNTSIHDSVKWVRTLVSIWNSRLNLPRGR